MDNETDPQAGLGPSPDLSEAGLVDDPGRPLTPYDDAELGTGPRDMDARSMGRLMDSLDYHAPAHGRRYRRHVRTLRRKYTRELRGVERWDDTAFTFYPPTRLTRGLGFMPARLVAERFNFMLAHGLLAPWAPEPKGREVPEPPKVPWPFRPQVETWEDEAVVPLPLGRDLDDHDEELARLIEEPRGGVNGGRAAPMDGNDPGSSRHGARRLPELGPEGVTRQDFLRAGGWHLERAGPTGEPPGRPRIDINLSPTDEEAFLAYIGDRATFSRLMRQGPKTPADREAKAFLEAQLAEVMTNGRGRGVTRALATLYDCSERTIREAARRGRSNLPSNS